MKFKYLYLSFIVITFCGNSGYAQSWRELNPPPNIFNESILSIIADSNGNLYAAGNFKNTNNEFIVAKWDGSNWTELKQGTNALKANNTITCIVKDKKGSIYAAGGFTNSTGNYAVAKWDGSNWSEVGGSSNALKPNNFTYAMAVDDSDNLYVAGAFTDSAGKQYVAKWNGVNWSELGTGANALNANGLIYSITSKDGNIYAAGHFTNSNGKYYVAKWDGLNWSELGTNAPLNANDYINCISTDKTGNIYAAGAFKTSSGDYYIAKYDGTNWSEVGNGTNQLKANGPINSMAINTAGIIYAGGFGTNLNGSTNVVQWNGSNWSEVFNVGYASNSAIRSICIDNSNNVWAAGDFKNNGGHTYVAKWDGHALTEPGRNGDNLNASNGINHIAVTPKGEVYVTGNFPKLSGTDYIAHWDGKTWSELGGDTASLAIDHNSVAMVTDPSGNLYVSGNFKDQNGNYYIAKWNGYAWSELGNTNNPIKIFAPITLLTTDKAGNLFASGLFGDANTFNAYIMKWNGSAASFIPSPHGINSSIVVDSNGNIYAANANPDANGKYFVEKIDQNGATLLGSGVNALNSATVITALAIDGNGNLLASGMNNAGYSPYNKFVAKWDGTSWSVAGTDNTSRYSDGYVESMFSDDSGYVYAASATNSNSYFSVAKWDGYNWQELGKPQNPLNASGLIATIATDGKGNIYAAGSFGYVAVYGKSALILQQPALSVVSSQYCNAVGNQTIKVLNMPDTFFISVFAKLDNVQVAINPDSSFAFNLSILSPGNHRIKVVYSTTEDSMFLVKDFMVTAAVTPDVNIIASRTTVTGTNPITITAVNAAGGGTNPKFTFAKDRAITIILQAESISNTFNLDPVLLSTGENRIFVRMTTSDSCYTVQSNIDSVIITKSVATGIVDIDNPNQQIEIYPNPFAESVTLRNLQSNKHYIVTVSNAVGQMIFQRSIRNTTSEKIDFNIAVGSYWLIIYDDSKKRLLGAIQLNKQ